MKVLAETNLPAEGSLRDFVEDDIYILQRYQFGVWETIIHFPFSNEEHVSRFFDFMCSAVENDPWPFPVPRKPNEDPLPPHRTWPFPTKPKPEEKTDPYEEAKRATEHL